MTGRGFLWGITAVCLTGYLYPSIGFGLNPYAPWLVALAMFLVGSRIKFFDLQNSLRKPHAIGLTLISNFAVMPVLSYALGYWLFTSEPMLFAGMMILGVAPTTLASSIVWTRLSGGNVSLALILTVCSTISSVLLVPVLLKISLGQETTMPITDMLFKLLLIIILPVLLSQLSRCLMPNMNNLDRPSNLLGHIIILVIVFVAVAEGAASLSFSSLLNIGAGALLLNALMSLYAYKVCQWSRMTNTDSIAVVFASSQKTLTVGLMIGLMYFGPIATLPSLVYHVFQQFSANALSQVLKMETSIHS